MRCAFSAQLPDVTLPTVSAARRLQRADVDLSPLIAIFDKRTTDRRRAYNARLPGLFYYYYYLYYNNVKLRVRARASITERSFPPMHPETGGSHRPVDLSSDVTFPLDRYAVCANESVCVVRTPGCSCLCPTANDHLSIPMMRFLPRGYRFMVLEGGGGERTGDDFIINARFRGFIRRV